LAGATDIGMQWTSEQITKDSIKRLPKTSSIDLGKLLWEWGGDERGEIGEGI